MNKPAATSHNSLLFCPKIRLFPSFNRANIRYFVEPKREAYKRVVERLGADAKGESGVIYTLSRASADALADGLKSDGFSALPYHAGLDGDVRSRHRDLFFER